MFSKFSYELKKLFKESKKEMYNLGHSYLGTEHFFLALLKSNNDIKLLLNDFNITYEIFKDQVIKNIGYGKEKEDLFVLTPLFKKVLEESIIISNELRQEEIETLIVFKSILDEGEGVAYRILCELDVDIDELYESLYNVATYNKNNYLNEIGTDLTEKARNGLVDIVVGRDKEINNIIEILLRKNKKNPLLIGPAGVGKTAVVEELANRIVNSNVPNKLLNKKIISISMASLVAGTKYRGEFEEKLLKIIEEIEKNNNYILFIDEIHTLVGAGGAEGAIDASNILKPALSRGNITVIGATTTEEYRKYFEDDKALSRRFQKVLINEPNKKELFQILKKIKNTYEKYHNVLINDDIIRYIVKVSNKYIKNRKEPDKSIDLLDEVSSMVSSKLSDSQVDSIYLKKELLKFKNLKNEMINSNKYNEALKYRKKERKLESEINSNFIAEENEKRTITKEDIDRIISNKYNVCLNKKELNCIKRELLNKFKDYSSELNSIFEVLQNIFDCDRDNNKSNSIMLTNNCNKMLSKIGKMFFNDNILNINLNEYSNEQSISRIVGSSPGYVGYNNKNNIFECLKEQPFYLIILSNYDNACYKVKELIKEILTKGFFTDSNGYKIDFSNSLIVINSNEKIQKVIGFSNKNKNKYELSEYVNCVINSNKKKISML